MLALNSSDPLSWIVPLISESKEESWHGTGFLIDNQTIMTAEHVVGHPKAVITAFCGNKKIKIDNSTKFIDQTRDIAVAKLMEPCDAQVIPLAQKNPKHGEYLTTIGCPEDLTYCGMVTTGIVSMYRPEYGKIRLLSDMRIWYGNSGGPVLNTDGALVGVVIEIRSFSKVKNRKLQDIIDQNFAIITPISEIIEFLLEYETQRAK